jgi:phospholipid transport system transporter-binding protein
VSRASLSQRGAKVCLEGELSFATVAGLLREAQPLLDKGSDRLLLDLKDVGRADSAGLALLLEWVSQCRRRGRPILLQHLPQALLDIARFSNVLNLLPLRG